MKDNMWSTAISVCVDILERRNFEKKLPATHGGIFYDYVVTKFPIEFSMEEKGKIWSDVIKEYKQKNGSYSELFKTDLKENRTCLNIYKGELVRLFFKNNKELLNEFKPNQDANKTD
jgi:hypothetical protein